MIRIDHIESERKIEDEIAKQAVFTLNVAEKI